MKEKYCINPYCKHSNFFHESLSYHPKPSSRVRYGCTECECKDFVNKDRQNEINF